jgi:prepilin-type N-terminal cleavage/methylation domain-containing protein
MKTPSKKSPRGFTLIELLVAMAITTIIITVLVSVTAMALETWNRNRAEIRAARQAKSMIDTMARDFESFVSRRGNTFEWLYAKSNPSLKGPKDTVSPNALDLIFFSAATDRYNGNIGTAFPNNNGDVSTVGYKLTYKDPIAGATNDEFKTFVLYRKIVNPIVTFANILGQATIMAPFDTAKDVADETAIDKEENFICENVYHFTTTLHLRYMDGTTSKTIRVPIGQAANSARNLSVKGNGITDNDGNDITGITGATGAQIKSSQLSAVEVSITVLSDFGIQQMHRRSDLTGTKLNDFIAQHSYQYSKVVQLPGS